MTADSPTICARSRLNDQPIGELEDLIHLYLVNRGICVTPFHSVAPMSPVTTTADVDLHDVFGALVTEL